MSGLKYGLDGLAPCKILEDKECCTWDLCLIDVCGFVCNFLNYLPSGLMWDKPKEMAVNNVITECSTICPPKRCSTLVDHARYTAMKTLLFLEKFVMPIQKETNPITAYHSIDDWLDKYGWNEICGRYCYSKQTHFKHHVSVLCLRQICPEITRYNQMAGNAFALTKTPVRFEYPKEINEIVKRGVLIALSRLSLNPILNLDSINFALSGLGVELRTKKIDAEQSKVSYVMPSCVTCNSEEHGIMQMASKDTTIIEQPKILLELCVTQTNLPRVIENTCGKNDPVRARNTRECTTLGCDTINTVFDTKDLKIREGCLPETMPKYTYPTLIVAECLLNNILPTFINYELTVCHP
jgi:hypothetical protein